VSALWAILRPYLTLGNASLVIVSLGLGGLGGWLIKPPRVEEKIRVEYVEKQVVVVQEKIVKVRVAEQKIATRVKEPDGTVTSRTETTRLTDRTKETDTAAKGSEVTLTREEAKPVRLDWRVGALVGYDVPRREVVYGASAERRIVGNLWGGAWGHSTAQGQATAGLKLALEF